MPGFDDILGHENIIRHMKQAVRSRQPSHAYILDGPALSGKRLLADCFARALQCERGTGDACGQCRSCKQARTNNQPDILYLQQEKNTVIKVSEIRDQINATVDVRPYSSPYKIYIIEDAQKMNQAAQNALLKTIEEPPAYAVFLLLTSNAWSFLPTIRSRCVMLRLQAVGRDRIRDYLMSHCRIPDYQADACAAFAQGNVGRAMQLAGSQQFHERKERMLYHVKKAPDAEAYEAAAWITELLERQEDLQEWLELLLLWYRDVLVLKSGGRPESLIFSDQAQEARKQAGRFPEAGLWDIIQAIRLTDDRIRANVNKALALELLFARIRAAAGANAGS